MSNPATAPRQAVDDRFPRSGLHIAKAADATFETGLRGHFAYRNLGMDTVTDGKVQAHIIKPTRPCSEPGDEHMHRLDFQMLYIISGWARMSFTGHGEVRLEAGDSWYQEPSMRHAMIEYSDDLELLEITMPADFQTISFDD